MKLTSPRLILSPFLLEDKDAFLAINTHPFVRKYLWDDEIISKELALDILEQNATQFTSEKSGLWKINRKTDNTIIGYTGLWYFFDEPQPQLLYALLPEYTSQGYIYEAANVITEYAFEVLNFDYLVAACDMPNVASQKVAIKLGMQPSKTLGMDGKPTLFFVLKKA